MRYLNWLIVRFDRPRAALKVIAIALVLVVPSLFSGFFIDEYIQAARWKTAFEEHHGIVDFLNNCFVFGGGSPSVNRWEMENGIGAWWVAPEFKTAFWRPIAAATHAIDLSLWPGNAVLMHAHSIFWFLALLLALYTLYRRFLAPRVATLALAIYAWDDARGQVLSWIAKRNVLVAGVFGICAIIIYDKWRRDGWRPGAWLAPILLGTALLSTEMGLATTGFLFAYALFLDKGSFALRMVRLAPYFLVVVVWQVAYYAGAYGVESSRGYIHPFSKPLAFAERLLTNVPILSLGQLTPIDSFFWGLYPPAGKVAVYLLALAVLVVIARIAWPRLKSNPQVRFWLIGAGLSMVPLAATGPTDGNLVFVGFGVAPALAMLFMHLIEKPSSVGWSRFVVVTLVIFNLAIAPLLLPAKSLMIRGMGFGLPRADASIPRDPSVTRKTLVVVWSLLEASVYVSWNRRYAEAIPAPRKWRILSSCMGDVSVTRLDEVTLRLCPKNGFLDSAVQQMMRDPASHPFRKGDVVKLSNMTATVTEITNDNRPKTVEFRFSAPLESPEWLWMQGRGFFGLANWTPPKVGETVVIKAGFK